MAVDKKTITRATCDAKQTTTLTLNIQLGGKTNFSKYSPCNSSSGSAYIDQKCEVGNGGVKNKRNKRSMCISGFTFS